MTVWTPFFYIEALIPGTSLLASDDVPVLKVAGMSLPPNLIVAAVLLLLTAAAYGLARDSQERCLETGGRSACRRSGPAG